MTLNRIGNQDAYVAKLDANGTVLWAKNFGGSGGSSVTAKDIAVDVSGNVYLTGYFMSASLTVPVLTRIGQANADAFAIKLDASGNTAWAKNYGGYTVPNGSAFTAGQSIAVDGSGNVYVCGYFQYVDLSTPALTKIGDQDAFVLKLDASGNTTWSKNYGGSGAWAQCEGIAVDGFGNVHMGGLFSSASLTTPILTLLGSQDAFVFKLDASGNPLWMNNYGGSGASTAGQAIALDSSGNVYLGGNFEAADMTNPALALIGSSDAFALKLDASGNTTWVKNHGGSGAWAYASGIAVDASGNVYLGGNFDASLTTPPLGLIGSQDLFALKLSTSGNTLWARNHGGSGANVSGNAIAADDSGNVYLAGDFETAGLTAPALILTGSVDALLIKEASFDIPASIPTLSEWGVLLLAGMLGLIGAGMIRRSPLVVV